MDGYPKIKAWMAECSEAAGVKEVHEPWAAEGGPVTTIVGIMNGKKEGPIAAAQK